MPTQSQFARFAIVGLTSNGILYLAYLLLTYFGLGPKTAVSILFVVGVTQTFFVNRAWTFRHSGNTSRTYVRYWVAYGMGYILNLALLEVFVNLLGYAHQLVQGLLVLVIAAFLFVLQKYWVFQGVASDAPGKLSRADQQ